MRRTITLTIAAALALTLAPFSAARAQDDQQVPDKLVVTMDAPTDGAEVAGTIDVKATIVKIPVGHQLKRWSIDVRPASGEGTHGVLCEAEYGEFNPDPQTGNGAPGEGHVISFKWNTKKHSGTNDGQTGCGANTVVPSGGVLSANGSYKIWIHAETTTADPQGAKVADDSNTVKVSNGPTTPTGVKLGFAKSSNQITVEWNQNPEPDVTKYRLQECKVDKSSKPCGAGDWETVADNFGSNAAAVDGDGPGIYRYRVAALRASASNETLVSDWATAGSEPTEIDIENPPPETTTSTSPATVETGPPPAPRVQTVVKPTRRVQRAAPQVVQRIVEEEPGYNTQLPYSGEEASDGLPLGPDEGGSGERAMLIPLAGGLVLLMFALQMGYLNKRAHAALEPVPLTDLDDSLDESADWE